MQTQSRTIQQTSSTLVIVDPLVARFKRLRKMMVISIAMAVIGWALIIGSFILASRDGSPMTSMLPLFIFVFGCALFSWPLSLINSFRQEHFWKRMEERRQAAANGEQNLLAAQQPVPNAQALSLPITIRQRPNWFTLLILPAILIVLVAILFPLMFNLFPQSFTSPHHTHLSPLTNAIIIGVPVLLLLLLCVVLVAVMYFKGRQQLTVTENGLIIPGFRKAHSISWQEARLFAIDGIFGAKNYQHPSIFEVSSARDIVRWTWIHANNRRVLFPAKPAMSTENYNQQMEAVLALIAGRTGLPLYDLRDKKGRT